MSKRRKRKYTHEVCGLTIMQVDFMANLVNDENWIGIDDTVLDLDGYIDYLENNDIMTAQQAGMMLTTLQAKNLISTERNIEQGVKITKIKLTYDGQRVFKELLTYCIDNDRIELFDPSMGVGDLL